MIPCDLSKTNVQLIQRGMRNLILDVRGEGGPTPRDLPEIDGVWDKPTAACARWILSAWEMFTSTQKKGLADHFFKAGLFDRMTTPEALDYIAALDVQEAVEVEV